MYNKAKRTLIIAGVVDLIIALALLLVFLFFLFQALALFGIGDNLLSYFYSIEGLKDFLTSVADKVAAVWKYLPVVIAGVSGVATLVAFKFALSDFWTARLDARSVKDLRRKLNSRALAQWFFALFSVAALFAFSNFSQTVNIPFKTLLYACIPSLVLIIAGFMKFAAAGIIRRTRPARYR